VDVALERLESWVDQLETKIGAIFALAAVLIGVVPSIHAGGGGRPPALIVAIVAWGVVTVSAILALIPITWIRLDPARLLTSEWLTLDPRTYQFYRATQLAQRYAQNSNSYRTKKLFLLAMLVAFAVEVLALTILVV
jgi:hypothetical protein